ncbi:GNAT family N-acetyltransferase [Thermosynechococcus sp. PP22]|uniref:GNAT family N-acetyltransferase n=1 Tax=Thermosynechococcus sp. PP22 TaxID=3074082 RepID=UPI00287395DA|nr:GNAT family N-acetyltransferase [Thermosynechococcus sp. PP22]WNC21724.1 GNAT family N-acetyltransferase [Thermosynechococcus sp. PP22]
MAEFAAALAPELTIQWVNAIASVPEEQWDALALPLETPFFEWEWLHQIEASGSATLQTGWLPHHLLVWRDRQGQRELVAAAPLYVKGHSQGEFVFDHQWAELAARLGIRYYPKLLGMAPFTPAVGYRFLMAEGVDVALTTKVMLHEIDRLCQRHRFSSCHFLYVDPQWQPAVEAYGYRAWLHHSYIWQNRNYQTFDDYLADFNANQRRNIKRERKAVAQADLTFRVHQGDEVSRSLLRQMYDFYADTCDKFGWWGSKYLTRQFFEALSDRYRHRVVLFAAYPSNGGQRPIAMSFCITKGANLYGRYWGSAQEIDCLHFNACYYEPIEWAIANGIQRFDPGAGGRHKKRRGFPATPNYSLHRFYAPQLAQIFDHYIDQINDEEQRLIDTINADLPMKQR